MVEAFLRSLPTQRRIWSAHSLAQYMACPRRYYYGTVEGWRAKGERSVDLTFGSLFHDAADVFTKVLASGHSEEEATLASYAHTLEASWGWGGDYLKVWRCDGKVKGEKGRPVKCPGSKQWNAPPASHDDSESGGVVCQDCGCDAPIQIVYFPTDKTKNRATLLRSVVAYCDAMSRSKLRPIVLPDGRIGSELSFTRELDMLTPDGDRYIITGSMDQVSRIGESELVIPEIKTTRREPNSSYYGQFEPGVQLYVYSAEGLRMFPADRPKLLKVVVQIGMGNTEVHLHPLRVARDVLREWEGEMVDWIRRAEEDAIEAGLSDNPDKSGAYARNVTACHSMPGAPSAPCPYRSICRLSPADRPAFLEANFERAVHNPTEVKGA